MEVTTTALNAYNEATKEETLPKKRGRKPKDAVNATEPKKRGRKPKDANAEAVTEEPKKRGSKKSANSEVAAESSAEKTNVDADSVNEKPAGKKG